MAPENLCFIEFGKNQRLLWFTSPKTALQNLFLYNFSVNDVLHDPQASISKYFTHCWQRICSLTVSISFTLLYVQHSLAYLPCLLCSSHLCDWKLLSCLLRPSSSSFSSLSLAGCFGLVVCFFFHFWYLSLLSYATEVKKLILKFSDLFKEAQNKVYLLVGEKKIMKCP